MLRKNSKIWFDLTDVKIIPPTSQALPWPVRIKNGRICGCTNIQKDCRNEGELPNANGMAKLCPEGDRQLVDVQVDQVATDADQHDDHQRSEEASVRLSSHLTLKEKYYNFKGSINLQKTFFP